MVNDFLFIYLTFDITTKLEYRIRSSTQFRIVVNKLTRDANGDVSVEAAVTIIKRQQNQVENLSEVNGQRNRPCSGADGHLVHVTISDISHLEAVVGAGDTIDCELPHTDDSEKISEPNVDVVEDVTDPPVDEVADEVSRLCHFK